ncbi:MAG: UvrD-helicase domain-containing protein [Bacilli bacterium]|nr:UvrD-helicase domain-containing protein [Bacilli bacterium]
MNKDNLFYIDGYLLDEFQIDCVKTDTNLLVVAGAGCGKTSTILGKVKYLIYSGIKEDEILCISLTNEATNGLKSKLNNIGYNVDCKTFHKLGLDIIKKYYKNINICSDNTLNYIVNEYFFSVVKYSFRKYILFFKYKNFNYNEIVTSKEFELYKQSIITFINLLKNKGYDINKIYKLYKKSIIKSDYLFLLEIYRIYENELRSNYSFDFNDMISIANNLVNEKKLVLKYKYIIIDEFQDTSIIRLNLIRSIMRYNNAKIMCVGDDYQSIYRFAGSDIELFLNFKKYFNNSHVKYLKNTYRNGKELLFLTNKFICKNKFQIKKQLYSNKSNNKPLKIFYSNNFKYTLRYLLNKLGNDTMVIGRNNKDINYYVEKIEDINNINYYTAHKSKGLESENVILINLSDNILGFPTKLINNKIISKLFDKELYKYDEERRLFYVALTRTKNSVYLIVDKKNESYFVKELIQDYKTFIEFYN